MVSNKTIKTSVIIEEDLWKEAKIEAIKRGMKASEFLNEALRAELRKK